MKRGTRIEYTYAAGKVVIGKIVKQHKGDMAEWYVCKLNDEAGEYSVSCHIGQIRNVDNRA